MKTLTIRFEFPDEYESSDLLFEINGSLTDLNRDLANRVSYTILKGDNNE